MTALQHHEEAKRLLGLAEDARLLYDVSGEVTWARLEIYYRGEAIVHTSLAREKWNKEV